MKRVQAEYPYEDYWLYVVYHKKENRRMANLILKDSASKVRKTISYARYLLSVHLKRILDDNEHVDHIDNDPMNDTIDNFQILTPEQNKAKADSLRFIEYQSVVCSGCSSVFQMQARHYRSRIKNGYKRLFCTKECYKIAK